MISLIYRKEPYVSWKNNTSKLEIVPTWSRPIQSNSAQNGNTLRAKPLKHWRKQLIPEPNSGSGISSIKIQDNPNSSTISNTNNSLAKGIIGPLINKTNNSYENVIKSARVSNIDNHYNSSASFMQGRAMLYRQKLSTIPIEGPNYVTSTGAIIWPSDDPEGTQNRSSIGFSNERCNFNLSIYKPNNNQFGEQGAVDSSSKVSRLKYNTIHKGGLAFSSAWSAYAENTGKPLINNHTKCCL